MAEHIDINYLAVLVAAAVHFGVGGLWYSPLLFGKLWSKLIDIDPEKSEELKKGATRGYILTFLGSVVMAYITAHIVDFAHASNVAGALETGFWLWLGYIATFSLTGVAFEGKPFKLYLLNNGYQLVGLMVMSVILTLWV